MDTKSELSADSSQGGGDENQDDSGSEEKTSQLDRARSERQER
jgi:hypothetical protein